MSKCFSAEKDLLATTVTICASLIWCHNHISLPHILNVNPSPKQCRVDSLLGGGIGKYPCVSVLKYLINNSLIPKSS